MTRRSKPYIVQSHLGDHEMPAREWHLNVGLGLLRQIGRRIARPAKYVQLTFEKGHLQLVSLFHVWFSAVMLNSNHEFFIYTSWLAIDRMAPRFPGSTYHYELMRQYGTKKFWQEATPADFNKQLTFS